MYSAHDRAHGRKAFGEDPQAYDAHRLDYPPELYAHLLALTGIGPASRLFEIGPGTGLATRAMLDVGVGLIDAVEADARLTVFLREKFAHEAAASRSSARPSSQPSWRREPTTLAMPPPPSIGSTRSWRCRGSKPR